MARLLTIAFVVGCLAAVQSARVPLHAPDCNEKDEYWKSGPTYVYSYKVNVESHANVATDRVTGTALRCEVYLNALGQCTYQILTKNCELATAEADHSLKKHARSSELSEELNKYPLAFHLSRGNVHDVIANEDEPVYITNIKRGIITNLQGYRFEHERGEVHVTDVQGTCPILYQRHENRISQDKDVNRCLFPSRPDWELSPSSLFWNMSFMQYGINAYSYCRHELTNSALQKSSCKERHSLRYDERTEKSHVQTVVLSELELQRSDAAMSVAYDPSLKGKRVTGIQYEYEDRVPPTTQPGTFLETANGIVDNIVASTRDGVQADSDVSLDELVRLLRKSPDVLEFTQGVVSNTKRTPLENEIALSFVRDALVTCNREPCINAISYLATHNYLSDNYLTVLLYKLTKVKVTKPGYLAAVCDICKAKPSRTCVLSLTSMIHTYVINNPQEAKANPPQTIKDTADYLLKLLNPQEGTPEDKTEKIILGLKAVGNLGDIAIDASPEILDKVRSYVRDAHKPHNVSLEAIKSLRRVSSHNQEVYNTLIGIVRDTHQHMDHRIVAYLVLTAHYHANLYEDIAALIPNEPTDQLGNFVTMHMHNVLLYGDDSLLQLKTSISKAFEKHRYVFVLNGERPFTTSRYRQKARLYKSPLVNDLANQFGFDLQSSAIYEPISYLPQFAFVNLTTQLFGKKFNSLTLATALHGLDPYLEFFFHFKTGGKLENLVERLKALQEHTDLSSLLRSSDWIPHFDSKIEQKLTEIHDSVIHDYGKQNFAATFNLKRYGDELAYTSWGIIKAKVYSFVEHDFQNIDWDSDKEYRVHRFVRLIEGKHQLPTLAGLPLKWKTNLDIVFSLRLDGHFNPFGLLSDPKFINAKWGIHPSGVVTMMNQMTVKVPKYTKSGGQAVTVLHRSRDKVGSLVSMMGTTTLKLEVSPKRQDLINFNRKLYFIRDGEREDIPDGNAKRVEKEDCYSCDYTGLKFCRHKSYVDVSDRRPVDIFANNLQYHVYYELADKELKAYELELKREVSDSGEVTGSFKFQAPGEKYKREVNGRYSRKPETREFNLQVLVPEKPHFKIEASRVQKKDGYVTDLNAEIIKGRPIVLHAESHGTPYDKETKVMLTLKDRTYNFKRKYSVSTRGYVIDHDITYESSNPKSLLHQILPDIFWESQKTAKVHLHLDVEKSHHGDQYARAINGHVKTPKSILELNTDRITGDDTKRVLHFNITRRELPSNEIQSFLHLTYDMVNNKHDDKTSRNHRVRVALPHLRWTAEIDRKYDLVDNKNYAVLKREKATDGSMQVTDATPVDKWEVSLKVDHHNTSQERGDQYPAARERHLDVVLSYPRDGAQQTISYKLKIVNDEGQKNAVKSFNTDSTLETSYRQLKFHGKSSYEQTREHINGDYNVDIENKRTGNKANYNAKLRYDYKLPLDFTQNYQSSRYTFKEALHIKQADNGGTDINLEMHGKCPDWDFLTFDLKQEAFIHPQELSTEKMQFNHKYFDIQVKSEFKLPLGKYMKKEINVKSKNSIFPTTNWYITHKDYTYYSTRVEYPEEKRNIYALATVDDNAKGADLTVTYDKDGSEKKPVINWSLRLMKSDVISSNCTTNKEAIAKGAKILLGRLQQLYQKWDEIVNDPNHPMNKFLQPLVKTTVADYIKEWGIKSERADAALRTAIREALDSLEPLYAPAVKLVGRIIVVLEKKVLTPLHESIIEKYLNHAEVQARIRAHIRNAVERMKERVHSAVVTRSDSGSVTFWHPLHWESLDRVPQLTPHVVRALRAIHTTYYTNVLPGTRYAVLYGDRNIHTFDGANYKVKNIPNKDCTYLLAHNFVARQYSLLGQKDHLSLLLPEIAITVDSEGKVSVDNEGNPIILPINRDNVDVTKHDHVIKITTKYGIDIEMDVKHHVVVVAMSFWNHNKTLGLLGNNDNERKNDYRKLDGHLARDETELLAHYELTGAAECSDRKELSKESDHCDKDIPLECYYLNKHNYLSPYYVCSDVVDPLPFAQSCLRDSGCGISACSSLKAYAALCDKQNIHLELPELCQ